MAVLLGWRARALRVCLIAASVTGGLDGAVTNHDGAALFLLGIFLGGWFAVLYIAARLRRRDR